MNSSRKMRRVVGGAMVCAGVIAAAVGLGSEAAQAAVPHAQAMPAAAYAGAADTGFAEFRHDYGFHPGHTYYAPRRYHDEQFPWFGPGPYGFHDSYR